MIHENYLQNVGQTPTVRIELAGLNQVDFYAKLEFYNPTGSLKDRAAAYTLAKALEAGDIMPDTLVVESSSGNFGVALAAYCRHHGLQFRCVVDPRITALNETVMRALNAQIDKVTEPDCTGGYLLTRLARVRAILAEVPKAYWTNQYENPLVADAYYYTLGAEICDAFPRIDFLFIPVSSGGTITGTSRRVKIHFPECRVVAVDTVGSVVFGSPPRSRFIPGMGSSMVPPILASAKIDDILIMDEASAIRACKRLLAEHAIFAGGSSGFVVAAVERYFAEHPPVARPTVVAILPDRGDRYIETIYNAAWCQRLLARELSDDAPGRAK